MRLSIVVDTSALMAIALKEADRLHFHEILLATQPLMALATRVEVGVVGRHKLGPDGPEAIATLLNDYGVDLAPLDWEQADIALAAHDRYGTRRGAPPAVLNYGDLFSYALAKARNLPLLYKGDDFGQTDVRSALVELGH